MRVQRACKYEFNVNNAQITLLKKHAGTSRFTYNCECGYSCDHNASKNLMDYPIFENIKKLTGKWVVPLNTVVANELFLNRNNVSRIKTPDGENVRSVDLSNDVGTVLDETGNEHQIIL